MYFKDRLVNLCLKCPKLFKKPSFLCLLKTTFNHFTFTITKHLLCKKNSMDLEEYNIKDKWQKSRIKWASHNDGNFGYFHGSLKLGLLVIRYMVLI